MKRTKSMYYKPTDDSQELVLYTVNDGNLYRGQTTAIIENLKKKVNKGTFDKEKAVDAFYYLADAAGKKYIREFGSDSYSFPVQVRFTAAVDLLEYYMDHITA